mmetsp:Transcript_122498/g.346403  ORF Transcript_122498/g.346403 Transcript_122498/m.346403 type:complete len:217 (-) Transcript_122498:1029-1679(-)
MWHPLWSRAGGGETSAMHSPRRRGAPQLTQCRSRLMRGRRAVARGAIRPHWHYAAASLRRGCRRGWVGKARQRERPTTPSSYLRMWPPRWVHQPRWRPRSSNPSVHRHPAASGDQACRIRRLCRDLPIRQPASKQGRSRPRSGGRQAGSRTSFDRSGPRGDRLVPRRVPRLCPKPSVRPPAARCTALPRTQGLRSTKPGSCRRGHREGVRRCPLPT